MTARRAAGLERGGVSATVLPDEGGVLVDLVVEGRSVLAATPWTPRISPIARPARSEATWVERWRGGWQVCFPTAGPPNPSADPAESFHGEASQAPWREVSRTADTMTLAWEDREMLSAERTWRLSTDGAVVATRVRNFGGATRVVIIAEHLILGGDVLDAPLELDVPVGTELRPLDYSGGPAGPPVPWPGDSAGRWASIDRAIPPRVSGLAGVRPQRIAARGSHVEVLVEWRGAALPHALLWTELGASTQHPWNGQVLALGIEPTSTPHGAGTALDLDLVRLPPGGSLEWEVRLRVRWTHEPETAIAEDEVEA